MPYVIAWIVLYYAKSLSMIYVSFVLLGLGIGLMEAPIFTYIGEICEPSIRGILTASASIAAAFGMGLVYFLGNQTSWRNAALVCATIPILSMFLISFVRHSWLLSRCLLLVLIVCYPFSSCLKLRCGCYRGIVKTMRCVHCNGFAVGFIQMPFKMNSTICNAVESMHKSAINVKNKMKLVNIRRQRYAIKFVICFVGALYGRLFWSGFCSFLLHSVAFHRIGRILCKFFTIINHQLIRM